MPTHWDKGIDYEYMYGRLLRALRSDRYNPCYVAIALIQLRNGLRASEAVRAFQHYIATKQIEFEVRLSKKKKPEHRLVVIPRHLLDVNIHGKCMDMLDVDEKKLVDRYKHYLPKHFNVNTHSLRYAFITYLLKQGINPSIIAKITRHSKLDYILTYTQEKQAEQILRSMI